MTISKSNAVLVAVVVLAIVAAGVVTVHDRSFGATALSVSGTENPSTVGLADTTTLTSSTGSALDSVDPATTVPNLDQFTSRDPFIQATSAPAPAASPSPAEKTPVAADVEITHLRDRNIKDIKKSYPIYKDKGVGAQLQPLSGGPVFKITAVAAGCVTFSITGYSLSSPLQVAPSNEDLVVLTKSDSKAVSYWEVYIGTNLYYGSPSGSTSGTGTGSGTSTTSSTDYTSSTHSVEALSIDVANGVPSATLVVDGTTYAAEKIGAVLTTDWGQIKIMGINGPAQTVTILHGDEQVTIDVGQSVSK